MFENIKLCQKCNLSCNQAPLLDTPSKCQIIWVGLSAKIITNINDTPLSPNTNTGHIIHRIEESYEDIISYKTNLVKCVPLSESKKIRYPNRKEINCCIDYLQKEIEVLSPKIVFLLGEKVYSSFSKHFSIKLKKWDNFNYSYQLFKNVYYIPIHHPSYIHVYKRKQENLYIESIQQLIDSLL
jgi:DNA polymerase